jgi:hemoglobin
MTSLYDEIGQEPAVNEAVKRFYERVLADPELSPLFEGVDMAKLHDHQVKLFTKVLGGPDNYSGRALDAAHRGLDITATQYGRVVDHLTEVLEELGVPDHGVTAVQTTLADVRPSIVERADV